MTMMPSIGYFLVVPKVGPKWTHFFEGLKANAKSSEAIDEQSLLKNVLPPIIEPFGW